MSSSRRAFLDQVAQGTLALGALPAVLHALPADVRAAAGHAPKESWDLAWQKKLTGKARACVDVAELESGYGVWRASIWANQYEAAAGIPVKATSTALVMRHNGIALAMTNAFWEKYKIGAFTKATHPLTEQPIATNPALLGEADGVPKPFSTFSLPSFMARGGIALACSLALQDMRDQVMKVDGLPEDKAMEVARAGVVPGVIVQPSGIFAVMWAQQGGAHYVRGS